MTTLLTFNGTNSKSIVIMDNCAIYHIADVTDLIKQTRALKGKGCDEDVEYGMQVLTDIDTSAFSTITAQDCEHWIADSHIYNI